MKLHRLVFATLLTILGTVACGLALFTAAVAPDFEPGSAPARRLIFQTIATVALLGSGYAVFEYSPQSSVPTTDEER